MTRLPLEPLRRASGCDTDAELAQVLGMGAVGHWRRFGVPIGQADRVATRCGFHPVNVWPEWETLVPPTTRTCACGATFIPSHGNQRWCTPECKREHRRPINAKTSLAYHHRQATTDPAYLPKLAAKSRAYRRSVKDARTRRSGRNIGS